MKGVERVKVETIRLGDIVPDVTIQTREPETFTVNSYRQAYRAGAKFPPIIVEKTTNRLVCGWHRYGMYRAECEPTAEIECIFETYPNELALWERAVSDNVQHGRPLDTWDKKRLLVKLQELGADKQHIAELLSVTTDKLEEWGGMLVVVTGQRNGVVYQEERPVKHGGPAPGTVLTETEYDRHVRCETGINARRHAFALKRLLENDWIERDDDKTLLGLRVLYDVLGVWLSERAISEE